MLFRLEKAIFLLLLFSIPFQTRVFLWSAGAVEGFNEWQSAFLYGTDLIIFALFGLFALRHVTPKSTGSIKKEFSESSAPHTLSNSPARNLRSLSASLFSAFGGKTMPARPARGFVAGNYENFKKSLLTLLFTLLLFAAISIFPAPYPGVGVYRFLKLAEFIGLFIYVVHIMRHVKYGHAALAFVAGGIFQAVIAVSQFFMQRSLGLKLLGESPLEAGRSDVAEFVSFGSRFMRAYGTLPSPNVLAAYLALAILFLILWHLAVKKLTRREMVLSWCAIVLLSFALLLTFSRAPIVAFALAFIFLLFNFSRRSMRRHSKKLFAVLAPLAAGILSVTVVFWPEIYSRIFTTFAQGDFALRERVFFNNLSFQIISDNLSGVGIGNYTLFLREEFWGLRESLYQPVHNIFLLVFGEIGIIGGGLFIMLCFILLLLGFKAMRDSDPQKVIIYTSFLFIVFSGLFDHFYLTLQQGSLMFWITAGMLYNNISFKTRTG